MICVKCGQQNPGGYNYCQRCNAMLPKVAHAAEPSEVAAQQKVNERYMQLKEAGDKVVSGEWTVEAYSSFLDGIARILAQKEQDIRDIEIPEEALEDFREELEVGFQGIEMYNQGIANMRLFLDDREPSHIQEGLELVREGNEMINEAMRINRDNRRKLEEMYIDTSTMI
ncbi:MAG: zinc ribbon domain-containing protein [Armatimonadetes bacterium]|nr:zinc ribbon domain-containing protein [Armatimonadota bacterium]